VDDAKGIGLAEPRVGELADGCVRVATGPLEIESRDLETKIATRDAGE
jgi:hypothetical protein